MNKIPLELANEFLDYNPETGEFIWKERPLSYFKNTRLGNAWNAKHANVVAGSKTFYGYTTITIQGQRLLAHRLAWLMTYGEWPDQIDHINGKRQDNRIENLRNVTHAENQRNRVIPRANKSGIAGVYWVKTKLIWMTYISHNARDVFLGNFTDFFEACCARKSAEVKYNYHPNHGSKRHVY